MNHDAETDIQQAAERVARVRNVEYAAEVFAKVYGVVCHDDWHEAYCSDCEQLANAYLDLRAEILAACLEESTYDGLYRRMMELHERGEVMSDRDKTYSVWHPDGGQDESDARRITASAPYQAAERWAEYDDNDSAEYSIVGGADAIVIVKAPDGKLSKFRVTGESVPSYYATLIREVK